MTCGKRPRRANLRWMAEHMNEAWSGLATELETHGLAAATANATLLRRATSKWSARAEVRGSMNDLLFTPPGSTYPFSSQVRVAWSDGVFTISLQRDGLTITGDKCTEGASDSVLSAFLAQLVGGET